MVLSPKLYSIQHHYFQPNNLYSVNSNVYLKTKEDRQTDDILQ